MTQAQPGGQILLLYWSSPLLCIPCQRVRISNYETIVEDDGVIPLFCYNYHCTIPSFHLPEMFIKYRTRLVVPYQLLLPTCLTMTLVNQSLPKKIIFFKWPIVISWKGFLPPSLWWVYTYAQDEMSDGMMNLWCQNFNNSLLLLTRV